MEDLYPAQLDGFDLEIETIDDSFEKSIVRHEFPNRDGALLEDMGQKARSVTVRCYFWDHGEHLTYARHIDLLNHLKESSLSELTHPQYGVMEGMIERISVRHDDREMTAEIDITFVENLRGEIGTLVYEDVEAAVEEAVVASQEEQMSAFEQEVRDLLGPEAVGILETVIDEGQSLYSQFQGYSQAARNYLKSVDTFVSTVEATLTEVANPANGLISAISYGTTLPGRVIGAVARCVERHVTLYTSTATPPSRLLSNLDQARLQLKDAAGFDKHLDAAMAAQGSYAVARIYKEDEASRKIVRRSETTRSFDTEGNYLASPATGPILTITELEASLATVRGMIQDAVEADRSLSSLKAMAKSLLDHVSMVKLERDRIVTISLDNPLPLHLVCHHNGLDYNYAERVSSINQIKNPTFTDGTVQIYGR